MKHHFFSAVMIASGLAIPFADAQERPRVVPGLWRMDITTVSKLKGDTPAAPASTEVQETCIVDEYLAPDQALDIEECDVSNTGTTSTTMSFKMVCTLEGFPTTGDGLFTVLDSGNRVSGVFNMQMTIPGLGEPLNIEVDIASQRIGDCDD